MPLFDRLKHQHPDYQAQVEYWGLLKRMVAGGKDMDEATKRSILVNPDGRPEDVVRERLKVAPYLSIMASILVKLQSQLLADEATYTTETRDSFWFEDFIPKGAKLSHKQQTKPGSLHSLLKQATLDALICEKAIAQIDTPYVPLARNREEQRELGGDKPYVLLRSRFDLWDWETDSDGFKFAKLHDYCVTRDSWNSDPTPQHRFLIYERKSDGVIVASRYTVKVIDAKEYEGDIHALDINKIEIEQDLEETEIFYTQTGRDRVYRFPVVELHFPSPLWLADQLYDFQKSYFNQTAALEWALISTNYAQLVFEGVGDNKKNALESRIGKAGNGYYWALPEGVQARWLERGGGGINLALTYRAQVKEAMLEVIYQIAANLATGYSALNRSGESKKEDRRNLDILLEEYGQDIAEFAKQILEIAAIARGEVLNWSVNGFNKYDSDSFLRDLEEYTAATTVVNSPTLKTESQKAIANRAVTALGLNKEILPDILKDIEQQDYTISPEFLAQLLNQASVGALSPQALLELEKQAGILPENFDVASEIQRLGAGGETENSAES